LGGPFGPGVTSAGGSSLRYWSRTIISTSECMHLTVDGLDQSLSGFKPPRDIILTKFKLPFENLYERGLARHGIAERPVINCLRGEQNRLAFEALCFVRLSGQRGGSRSEHACHTTRNDSLHIDSLP
jgi:hypothetical protein